MFLSLWQVFEQQVNKFMSNPDLLLFSLLPLLILILAFKWLFTSTTTTKNLPPSPPKFPIIGNIHQFGPLPHRALWSLAQRYGPLMLLKLGQVPTLVLSSPETACEILKNHDLFFANKHELKNLKQLFYDMKDISGLPYGEHWRQLRSTFVHHLLTKKRVQSFRSVREEETALLMRRISESCSTSSPVDLRDCFVTLSNDVQCRAAFGRKFTGGENGEKLKWLLSELAVLMGAFTFQDYVPLLGWLDRVRGMDSRVKNVARGLDEFLEGLIEERTALLEDHSGRGVNLDDNREDFVDTMLKIQKDDSIGISLSRDNIKAMLLDAYVGGTDTTLSFLEWAMSELLRNPNSMKKLQDEVRAVLNGKLDISEDDIEKMLFLKAVIKETLRIHPPVTLITRTTKEDTKLMGYDIAAGTMVVINTWGIANDPKLWDEPHEFRPERFLDSSIDFRGQHFVFTPFGAGRRQCPGISFGTAVIEYVLANLMYKFDWEPPRVAKGEAIDMTECPGPVSHRAYPLWAIATPHQFN